MSTILVLGATGNVGQHVVDSLANKADLKIRAATRDPAKTDRWKGKANVQAVKVDTSNLDTIDQALHGADKLFLLVPAQVPDYVGFQKKVVDLAKKNGVKHIVKLSAYNIDNNGYYLGNNHKIVEDHIKSIGIPLTSLRPTSFNSNIINFAAGSIKNANGIFDASGSKPINRVDERDIAAVAAAALSQPGHEGKVYDILGPDNITQAELAQIIGKAAGKQVNYVDVGEAGLRDYLGKAGMPGPAIDAMWDLFNFFRNGGYDVKYNGVIESVGGKKPVSLEQFIQENVAAFK